MKKALCVLAILAMAVTATATVRVFVTTSSDGYGLTIPSNHNIPTYSDVDAEGTNLNAYDYYYGNGPFVCAAYPPIGAPSGSIVAPVEILEGDWAYIWIQFQDEPKNAKINGLKVEITGPGGFFPTYYVQNDLGSSPSKKRWDGTATPAGYTEWHNNPQTMVAVTAAGIVNSPLADPQMMFLPQSGTTLRTGVALLGAIDLTAGGLYNIDIIDINYASGVPAGVAGGVFHFTPEPASLLLMALAGLILRRR